MDTRELDQKEVAGRKANGAGRGEATRDVDADEPRTRSRRPLVFGIIAVVVIVAALVWGIPWLNFTLSHEGTDDAHVAADEVAVTSKIPERINKILVDTNQPVRRGQSLIVLDQKTNWRSCAPPKLNTIWPSPTSAP